MPMYFDYGPILDSCNDCKKNSLNMYFEQVASYHIKELKKYSILKCIVKSLHVLEQKIYECGNIFIKEKLKCRILIVISIMS